MNRTLKNIIYNGVYQLLVIALPVITVPYVARILGAKSLGINSYVVSIGNILGYVIMMGLNQYGVRTIARSDRNTKSLKKEFLNLWILQLIVGIIVVICYSLFSFYNKDRLYFLANLPYLIGFTIDISWFFIGIEKIKDVVIRNTFVKFVTVFFIFVLVHSPNDLYIYILI
ncbi:oligosaccharide flippase family protein, partial [Pediococcus pentosaceus]